MKKTIVLILVTVLTAILSACGNESTTNSNNLKNNLEANTENSYATMWREVPISKEKTSISDSREPFDLREIITGYDSDFDYQFNTYIFNGTIIGFKEYEVSWTDENGEVLGPYNKTILEVKVNEDYYGKSPVENDILKVYYPYSLSWEFNNSVRLAEKCEYVFITRVLDDEYVKFAEKFTPGFKGESEKYADVCLNETYYRLFPIDNGNVFMNNGYFYNNEDVMKKVLPYNSVKSSKLISSDSLETGYFIVLNTSDFEKAFLEMLKNPEKLPAADKLHEQIDYPSSNGIE